MSYTLARQSPAPYKFFVSVCGLISLKVAGALPVPSSNFSEELGSPYLNQTLALTETKIKTNQTFQSEPNQIIQITDLSPQTQNQSKAQNQQILRKKNRRKSTLKKEFQPKKRFGPGIDSAVPTVIFHGIRQKCSEEKLTILEKEIQKGTGGHAECIEIGNGEMSSIFTDVLTQAEQACNKIQQHPVFSEKQFNIVGLSQGSLIGRYIVQSCNIKYPVRNLITVGAPNNGLEFSDKCEEGAQSVLCEMQKIIQQFTSVNPYSLSIQTTFAPSNYMRDHLQEDEYLSKAQFLPILNNERTHSKSNVHKNRFESLNSLTMVKFLRDPIIYPIESSWFGQISPDGELIKMEETQIYKQNTFGLRTLDEEGRVFKEKIDGEHLEYGPELIQSMIVPALKK